MAHSCPDCYQTCYCGGDIDDLLLDDEEDVNRCTHYEHCLVDPDDLDDEIEFAPDQGGGEQWRLGNFGNESSSLL